jgi:hypothetical protein
MRFEHGRQGLWHQFVGHSLAVALSLRHVADGPAHLNGDERERERGGEKVREKGVKRV